MINNTKQYKNIILIGAPGSGKGTLSEQLISKLDYLHFSTGDMFRDTLRQKTPLAMQIKSVLMSGNLMPDAITNQMISSYITKAINDHQHFVLDGYPRTVAQATFLDKLTNIDLVIYLDISKDLAIKRISGRRVCPNCNRVYNIYFAPTRVEGKCDNCDTQLIQRKDDNELTAKTRFDVYNNQTAILVNYYEKQNKLLRIKIDENTKDLLSLIENQLTK